MSVCAGTVRRGSVSCGWDSPKVRFGSKAEAKASNIDVPLCPRKPYLAEQHQLNKRQAVKMMEDLIGMITKHLKKGERVKIAGLGILLVRNRAARMGRNPMTGEAITIKASKKVAFRAAKDLKMAI